MAVGVGRAALEEMRRLIEEAGHEIDYDKPAAAQHAAVAEFIRLESDWEAGWLLTLRAAWMMDNREPNSVEASMSKAKAGRTVTDITNKAVEVGATVGFAETSLLEKWARRQDPRHLRGHPSRSSNSSSPVASSGSPAPTCGNRTALVFSVSESRVSITVGSARRTARPPTSGYGRSVLRHAGIVRRRSLRAHVRAATLAAVAVLRSRQPAGPAAGR